LPVLREALADSDVGIRWLAARVLENIGAAAKPAMPELQRALDDSDEGVRKVVARVLKQIGEPMPAP
jgi:HEAT repeat protein